VAGDHHCPLGRDRRSCDSRTCSLLAASVESGRQLTAVSPPLHILNSARRLERVVMVRNERRWGRSWSAGRMDEFHPHLRREHPPAWRRLLSLAAIRWYGKHWRVACPSGLQGVYSSINRVSDPQWRIPWAKSPNPVLLPRFKYKRPRDLSWASALVPASQA
jgi:hypothetical protein